MGVIRSGSRVHSWEAGDREIIQWFILNVRSAGRGRNLEPDQKTLELRFPKSEAGTDLNIIKPAKTKIPADDDSRPPI